MKKDYYNSYGKLSTLMDSISKKNKTNNSTQKKTTDPYERLNNAMDYYKKKKEQEEWERYAEEQTRKNDEWVKQQAELKDYYDQKKLIEADRKFAASGDDVRQEKQYKRYMNQLEEQKKALDKQRQFNVSGDDVRQEKQYKRYQAQQQEQKKLLDKDRKFAASGEDVRTEKKYNRYLDKKADYEQQRKDFMDYIGSVGKSEKEMTRAESRYQSAVNSWNKTKQEKPENEEIGDLEKQLEDYLAAGGKQQKNSNNVFFGDMDQGTWGSARPEAVSQSWLIKNIDKQREEYETAKENGLYDYSNDVSLWSTKKREAQKKQNLDDEMRIQSEIDDIHRQLNGEPSAVRLEDEDVQKYREILMGDYSDEEKEAAQAALEEIYQRGEGAEVDRTALVERERNLTSQLRYIRAQNKEIDGYTQRAKKYQETFGDYTPEDTEFHSDIESTYDFNGYTDVAYIYQLLEEKQLNGEHQIFGERNYPEAYLMNKEETEFFTSYVNEGKLDEAWAFYSGLRPYLNEAYSKYEASMWEDAANRYPILSFFAARGANVLQIPQFVMSVPGYVEAMVTGKENYTTDPYGKLSAESRIKNLIDNKISNNIGDYGWVYSGFASGVDSAINASIAQGLGLPEQVQFGDHIFKAQNVAMLSLFASQAFETSLQNVMAQGNNNFAYDFMEAFVDSVIETATEIWSVENFLADPTNIMTYITKLAISEPSEEVAGAIIEPFIKEMIGHGNQYKVRADEIWHNGYYEDANGNKVKVSSFDEAERQAMREWNHDIRMAAQEALISVAPGGMYGAAKMASENQQIGRQVQSTQFENGTTGLENMLESAQAMEPGTKSYQQAQKISEQLQNEQKPSNFRVGQLARDIMRESQEQAEEKSKEALRNEVRKELAGKEIRGSNEAEMTDLIMKAIDAGGIDNLSKKERVKIHDSSIAYNTYLKYVYASEQSTRAMEAQEKATQAEQKAMKSVSDALSNRKVQTQAEDTDFVGRQLATQEDIDRAEGKRTKRPDEIIVDRKYARLDGMELVDEGDGKQKWMYKVQTENGTEYKDASEIKATNFSTAAVVRQQQLNPEVYSGDYTNELLKQINTQPNTKIGRYMMEAEQVRWAAFAGLDMPVTSAMSEKQAQEIYRISQADKQKEWAADQASRVSNFKGRGKGQAFFDGAEFGTEEWTKKLDGMDLSQEERQLVEGLAAFAQDSGIRFDFVDQINGNDYIHGSENQGGIRIALQSYDSARAKQEGRTHHLAVTVGHELTHWMRRNNAAGYIELQDYVMRSMTDRGINVAARAMEMMENRRRNGDNLTMSGAIEEIVANACDQALTSEEGVQRLEQENPKLAEKIRGFIKDLVQRIKAAIGMGENLSSASRDAMMMVGEEANRLHKLWWGKFDETLSGQVKELQAPAAEGKENYSFADMQQLSWDDQLDKMLGPNVDRHDIMELANTDETNKFGIDVPIALRKNVLTKMMRDPGLTSRSGHKFNRTDLINIKESIIHPAAKITRGNTTYLISDAKNGEKPIVLVGNYVKDYVKGGVIDTKTIVRRENITTLFGKYTDGRFVPYDDVKIWTYKENAGNILSIGPVQFGAEQDVADAIKRLTQKEEKSNLSMAELDSEYDKAVKSGNTETMQRLVDEAAKRAGYTKKVYHGTPTGGFTQFKDWSYFTENKEYAGRYNHASASSIRGNYETTTPMTYELFMNPGRVFDTRKAGVAKLYNKARMEYGLNGLLENGLPDWTDGRDIIEYIEDNELPYDTIILDEGADGGYGEEVRKRGVSYVTRANMVKSAAPVTYDDNGKVIPLSERFKEENNDIRWSMSEEPMSVEDALREWDEAKKERDALRQQYQELNGGKEHMDMLRKVQDTMGTPEADAAIEEYSRWEKETGLGDLARRYDEAKKRADQAAKNYDRAYNYQQEAEERAAIANSGLSEQDWRRKQAVKEFGYTTNFREAGYLLPNGQMLNFTGEKGKHYGTRGQDHRAIGTIYAGDRYTGSEAMLKFMDEGNIRVMAETPGIDISSTNEPTSEQYSTIRKMARQFASEEYFNIDFTDARGNTVDSIEYDGRVNPEKIVNDIKYFFRTGAAPQQSVVSQFHYSMAEMEKEYDQAAKNAMDYLKKNGKLPAGSRMDSFVKEAAQRNGYTDKAYHGTMMFGFTKFDTKAGQGTIFVAYDEPVARTYTESTGKRREIYTRNGVPLNHYVMSDKDLMDYYVSLHDNKFTNILSIERMDDNGTQSPVDKFEYVYQDNIFNEINTSVLRRFEMWQHIENATNANGELNGIYELYTKPGKQLVVDADGKNWNEIPFDTRNAELTIDENDQYYYEPEDLERFEELGLDTPSVNTRELAQWAQDHGYDSVRINNVWDDGGRNRDVAWEDRNGDIGIFFNPADVKSADRIVLDDQGKVIPLSERFNDKNTDIRWSMAEEVDDGAMFAMTDENAADIGVWMMSLTPSSVHTEGERALIQEYRGLKTAIDLTRKKLIDYRDQLKRLQKKGGMLTTDESKTMTELEARIQTNEEKMARLEQELYEVTRGEGYAAMMYRNSQIYKDHIEGKSQIQVEAAVDQLMNDVEDANKEIGARQKVLNRMSEESAVKTVRRELRNRGLKQNAAALKDSYFTTMSNAELEARLAEIVVKAANGEDAESIKTAIDSLAADIVNSPVSRTAEDAQDALRPLKGRTVTFGPSEQAELKAIGYTLAEIRSMTKGSGITFKFGENSTLQGDLEEIAKEAPAIRDELMDKSTSAEQAAVVLVDWVAGKMKDMKGNPKDFNFDTNEVRFVVLACIQQMLNENQGGMTRVALKKKIDTAAGEIGKMADAANSLMETVQKIRQNAIKASNAAGGLRGDMAAAVDYYNLIARQAAEVERARVKRDVIEKLRSENTKKLIEQQQKYQEMMKKDRRARELQKDNESLRKVITTDAKRLKDRLVAETDQKNIPEEAKPLARMLVSMLVNHDMAGWRRVLNADKKMLADVQTRLAKMDEMNGTFDMDADLDWLVIKTPNPEDYDYSIRDSVLVDLMNIEQGLVEYRTAEGRGNVSLQDRKNALDKIQKAVSEIYDVIKARETAFIQGQKWQVIELAEQMEKDMENSRFKGERTGKIGKAVDSFWRAVGYGNLTPEYFIKNLKNRTMSMLHRGMHEAEQQSGLQALAAKKRLEQIAKDTGYATWDGQQKHQVKLENGKVIEMSTEQIMSLYATWNREKNQLRPEETAHLLHGGFVLAKGDTTKGVYGRDQTKQRPTRMSENDLNSLGGYLTDQQKAWVDKIVEYMSTDMAKIGNEASMKAYGIKKFTEKYYFPIKSWGGVLNKSSSSGVNNQNENRAMRQSFSRRVMNNARNAIEIGDFTATAMKHITGMITFNTVGPAVENLNKVLNQQLDYNDSENMDPDENYKRNMRAAFVENYGQAAYDYLTQFMKDVNGGVGRRIETSMREKLLSMFKKNAVAGSLSVAAQQPLSYIRAAMLINPKYLAAAISPQYWKGSYQEMLEHSGLAVIKDMGKFDMNFGQSMTDYITPDGMKSKKEKVNDASEKLTSLPGKMDAMTWTRMWSAVKLEQAALHPEMDVKSEEFLDMVADRFNELMRRTQVYDSVMVKSQNMRSDSYLKKVTTSFMAEPTLSLNVLADAWMNMKEKGGKANAAKALATFILSAAAQAGAKAFFGTGRSPDKKKTEEENFLNKFLQNLLGEANPFGLIPGYSQLVEVLINGELNDDAMGMIGKATDAVQKIFELATGDIGKKGLYRDLEDSIGQVVQLATDVPLKNVMREFRAMVNWFSGGQSTWTGDQFAQRETSAAVLKMQSIETLMTKELGGIWNKALEMLGNAGYKTDNTSYVKRIYDAQKSGDQQKAADIREYMEKVKLNGKDPGKWIDTQLNTMLKEDDSLSTEEKMESLGENGYGSMGKYINDQYRAGEIDRKTAEEYYRKENPTATDKDVAKFLDKTDWEKDGKPLAEGQKNYTNYTPLYVAMQDNKVEDIRNAVEHMKEIGYTEKDIKTEIGKSDKTIHDQYMAADADGRRKIRDAMQKAYKALGFTAEDADKTISGWTKKKK